MTKRTPNVYIAALERYHKELSEAKTSGDLERVENLKWKIQYFKDKIKQRKTKND